jgi:hypothetical protein
MKLHFSHYAHRIALCMLVASGMQATQADDKLSPQSFAYHTQIDLPANGGPFYEFSLPLPVYQGSQSANLADLRVFNGQGEIVPHTLLHPQSTVTSHEQEAAVPVFPITQNRQVGDDKDDVAMDVQRKSDGTLVAVKHGKGAKEVAVILGAVFDVSQIKDTVHALHLDANPTSTPFHAFSLETSDDLQQWRALLEDAQWVHLQQSGQVIDKNTFEWDGGAGKYLRIVWSDPNDAPTIKSASVQTIRTAVDNAHMIWTDPLKPEHVDGNRFDYPLAGQLPVEKLRIGLAQINTLAPLQVQNYLAPTANRQHAEWTPVMQSVVYRLQSPKGEVVSPDLALTTTLSDRIRLVVDNNGGGIGNTPPTVQFGFTPETMVFLSRGNGPFTLAWGAHNMRDGSMPATTLLPNFTSEQEFHTSQASLQAIAPIIASDTKNSTPEEGKTSKPLLWGILGIGLLVLGAMALMLVKQMKQDNSGKHP